MMLQRKYALGRIDEQGYLIDVQEVRYMTPMVMGKLNKQLRRTGSAFRWHPQ